MQQGATVSVTSDELMTCPSPSALILLTTLKEVS